MRVEGRCRHLSEREAEIISNRVQGDRGAREVGL